MICAVPVLVNEILVCVIFGSLQMRETGIYDGMIGGQCSAASARAWSDYLCSIVAFSSPTSTRDERTQASANQVLRGIKDVIRTVSAVSPRSFREVVRVGGTAVTLHRHCWRLSPARVYRRHVQSPGACLLI